ncbi:SDR family oxidoreductase [Mucilaginibacter phyllosphaerae]|uniref:Oxidoreductase n=1 Tax=Mucilaginibacter phyllosphaerae TaxID=1812349 RepID=A0A4Y8A7M4_9SPHI|nr:SDR family NAD(P)-dependent oxidoreductase [Mucilaginibacter phyllosphaerae]MBB3971003.1 putative oxidoreductase [Mucilaginibacter phyllosphaerae]TEW63747.1 SDR family NAD(P)-dependent oxidoreductase [Mucilaginibacter phyllosphaerae]GGH21898.1 putative oxidoreductase DltE [Mucilaginibacter phyllosphaerae]
MNTTANTILITGGTSGIGLAFAEAFLKEGNKVIITGRREDKLKEIKEKLPQIITKTSDVTDAAQRAELFNWINENHTDTNILINNAGVQFITDLKKGIDTDKLKTEVDTNLIAPIHLASLFIPHLKSKPNAAIINITSGLAFVPIAMMAVYCATKAAMHSLTLSLRYQLKDTDIKVFAIAPPAVDTELGHDRREDKTQSHGGIPVNEFIAGAMAAIKNDEYDAAIGMAAGLRAKRETLFEQINSGFPG